MQKLTFRLLDAGAAAWALAPLHLVHEVLERLITSGVLLLPLLVLLARQLFVPFYLAERTPFEEAAGADAVRLLFIAIHLHHSPTVGFGTLKHCIWIFVAVNFQRDVEVLHLQGFVKHRNRLLL